MLEKISRIVFLIIAIGTLHVLCASTLDESFEEYCLVNGGKVQKGKTEKDSDKCTLHFDLMTLSQKQADDFCRAWIPYQFISSVRTDKKVSCNVEIRTYCEPGWVNLYDTCYLQLIGGNNSEPVAVTRPQAVEECKKLNSTIIQTFRADLPETLSYFFQLSSIWVDFEVNDPKFMTKVIGTGTAPAMVFEEARLYHVPYMTVVRLDGFKDKVMAICEKDSQKSDAYYAATTKIYEQIGFHGYVMNNGEIYYQTLNHYSRRSKLSDYDKTCNSFMRPYLGSNIRKQSFVPTVEHLSEFKQGPSNILIRTGAQRTFSGDRKKEECVKINLHDDAVVRTEFLIQIGDTTLNMDVIGLKDSFKPKRACDSQMSLAFKLGAPNVYESSDAFRAPLLCGIEKQRIVSKNANCRFGWKEIRRPGGILVCHKKFRTYLTWDESQRECITYGGTLSGFETLEEYNFLRDLERVWLGGRVRKECEIPDFSYETNDMNSNCTRERKFVWYNNAAKDETFLGSRWLGQEPNNINTHEYCLQMYLPSTWQIFKTRELNDEDCSSRLMYCCQVIPSAISGIE